VHTDRRNLSDDVGLASSVVAGLVTGLAVGLVVALIAGVAVGLAVAPPGPALGCEKDRRAGLRQHRTGPVQVQKNQSTRGLANIDDLRDRLLAGIATLFKCCGGAQPVKFVRHSAAVSGLAASQRQVGCNSQRIQGGDVDLAVAAAAQLASQV
jgi:hypothetical protein